MSADLRWPLGRSADRVVVVLQEDADLISPILAGEQEPEDCGGGRWVPLAIQSVDVPPTKLADELAGAPEPWFVVPSSDAAADLYGCLAGEILKGGGSPPVCAMLPPPLTLRDVVRQFPQGEESIEPGRLSRHGLLIRTFMLCAIAAGPPAQAALFILEEAAAPTALFQDLSQPRPW